MTLYIRVNIGSVNAVFYLSTHPRQVKLCFGRVKKFYYHIGIACYTVSCPNLHKTGFWTGAKTIEVKHWLWLVTCLMPSHNLNQCWLWCQLDPQEQISVNTRLFIQEKAFENVIWKMASEKCGPFYPGLVCYRPVLNPSRHCRLW